MLRERSGGLERGQEAAKRAVACPLALAVASFLLLTTGGSGDQSHPPARPEISSLLTAIVAEVKELGRHPGEDFIRWEFFLGEDDDDTNKDIHAVVVIHEDPPPLRLRVHVTDLERLPANSRVRVARRTRVIFAVRAGDRLTIEKSDYPPPELVPVLRSLVKAIRDKKRLLRQAAESLSFKRFFSHYRGYE